MDAATARAAITARIAALTPAATYADVSFALGDATWTEATTPLIPEKSPDTTLPLAFWVDDREWRYQSTRSGHDPKFVSAPVVVRFLYPLRENGTPNQDWDRSSYAAEALIDHLIEPSWAESAADLVVQLDPGQTHRRRVVGDGTVIVWEIPLLIQFQRS